MYGFPLDPSVLLTWGETEIVKRSLRVGSGIGPALTPRAWRCLLFPESTHQLSDDRMFR